MPDTDTPIDFIPGRRQVTRRTADAMLRVLGGEQITVRLADPSAGDTNSQLGITPPTSSDIQIAPAVVQVAPPATDGAQRVQVLLSAKAVQPIAESYGVTNIPDWLMHSQGLLYRGQLLPITTVVINQFAGGEYLYLLTATE
jgi:hypothetical protein